MRGADPGGSIRGVMRSALSLVALTCTLTPAAALGYGEADAEGRPSAIERQLHLLTNQVRADPAAFPGWDATRVPPGPRPPLALDPDLSAAARFHAEDMASAGCFSHDSCDGTSFFDRIRRFFSGPAGENIALGHPDSTQVMVGWMNSPGHRDNILRDRFDTLGTGYAEGRHWVQNFGVAGTAPPRIVGGAAFPAGGRLRLAAHAYAASGRAPERFVAILDDEEHALSPAAGQPGHRIWDVEVPAASGCASLAFLLQDPGGATTRFPTSGQIRVGAGCADGFEPAEPGDPANPPSLGRPVLTADEPGGCRCAAPRAGTPALLGGLILLGLGLLRRARR